MRRWVRAITLMGMTVAAVALMYLLTGTYPGGKALSERWNPFAPYDVHQRPGPFTPLQYWRTLHDAALCKAALARTDLHYTPIPDTATAQGCALQNVVRVTGASVRFNHPFLASCPLALALARFETQDLQAAAHAAYGHAVVAINHVGSYACRDIRTSDGRGVGTLSQHAQANAIDLSGFTLDNGRIVSIGENWHGVTADTRFLHALHTDACRAFNTTLGPDYNALHSAHFHVDMGPSHLCG